MRSYPFIALAILLGVSGCEKKSESQAAAPENTPAAAATATPAPQADATPAAENTATGLKAGETINLPSGSTVTIIEAGTGSEVDPGDRIIIDYVGKLEDGTTFDDGTLTVDSAGKGMIVGMNEAMLELREGSKVLVKIPSEAGYGQRGFPGVIPPNSNLEFEVTVKKVEKAK